VDRLRTVRSIRTHVLVFLGLILIQFWLGMTINLEVTLPSLSFGGVSALTYFAAHYWQVLFHMIVAVVILAVSVRFLILSLKLKSRPLIVLGIIGLAAIVAAIYNGISFLLSNQFFGNSIGMAMSAVSSIVAYALALYYIGSMRGEDDAARI
jgi:hypothetical protein